MSSPRYAAVPAATKFFMATWIAAEGTKAKMLTEPYAAAVASATEPAYYGGCAVIDLTAAATGAAPDVILWVGEVRTTQGTDTGVMATGTNSIARTTGSFISDGWKVGKLVMIFAPVGVAENASVDGILGVITGVTATSINVNGTPFAATSLTAGTRIVEVCQLFRSAVVTSSGDSSSVSNEQILGDAMDTGLVRLQKSLGPTQVLIASLSAAVGALPLYLSLSGQVARY